MRRGFEGRTLRAPGALVCAVGLMACGGTPSPQASHSAVPSPEATPAAGHVPGGTALYSQHNEELVIRGFFHDRRDGFFLDVGCASPIQDSNTYYLEKHLGWSGIGVDALPEFAATWLKKRPRSRFFNFLVSDHSDTVEPFYRSELRGTSSARKDDAGMKGPGGQEVKFDELHVPTTTLTRLLDANGVKKIDFLSMDIEGFEPLALAGFDIERFRPELACIEIKPATREKILAYFAAHGYRQIEHYLEADPVNYYFTPRAPSRGPS